MKRLLMLAAFGFVVGCGGSDSGKTFVYDPPIQVSSTDAATLDSSMSALADFAAQGTMTDASAGALMGSPMTIFAIEGTVPTALAQAKKMIAKVRSHSAVASATATDVDWTCGVPLASNDEIDFNCDDGLGGTLTGWIRWTAATASWSIVASQSDSLSSYSLTYSGNVAVTSSTIAGSADLAFLMTDQGVSVGFTITSDYNVGYDATYCIDAGYYDVQLVWTHVPSGYQAEDVAYKFDWAGCDDLTLSIGH